MSITTACGGFFDWPDMPSYRSLPTTRPAFMPTSRASTQHELIRKYRCGDCGGVMPCACDEPVGRRFLSHQLHEGYELDTQLGISVTTASYARPAANAEDCTQTAPLGRQFRAAPARSNATVRANFSSPRCSPKPNGTTPTPTRARTSGM